MKRKMSRSKYLGEDWRERILPIFILPPDHYTNCERHGEYLTHAYYEDVEISSMLASDGWVSCPECLSEICNG